MTTQFDSKEQALEMGLFYAGFKDEKLRKERLKELLGSKTEPMQIGWPQYKPVDLYKTKNLEGDDIGLGIGEFREGYDLWLVSLKTEFCQRV